MPLFGRQQHAAPPRCSFCGRTDSPHYVSGPHQRYICRACIERPIVEGTVPEDASCAFCDRRIGARRRRWQRELVQAAIVRWDLVACHRCRDLMQQVLATAPPAGA
jgi:hypothetical protein